MNQNIVNKINDCEFELMYNSLFSDFVSVSKNKVTGSRYANFMVNRLISGEKTKIQSVELVRKMSPALQAKKASIMDSYLNSKENNFAEKFNMGVNNYTKLKPEVETELCKSFASNVAKLEGQKLLSLNAVNYASEKMNNVDSRFKTFLLNTKKDEDEVLNY